MKTQPFTVDERKFIAPIQIPVCFVNGMIKGAFRLKRRD